MYYYHFNIQKDYMKQAFLFLFILIIHYVFLTKLIKKEFIKTIKTTKKELTKKEFIKSTKKELTKKELTKKEFIKSTKKELTKKKLTKKEIIKSIY